MWPAPKPPAYLALLSESIYIAVEKRHALSSAGVAEGLYDLAKARPPAT